MSFTDKLETLKSLDSGIVELTSEEDLVEEIEQADGYKEKVLGFLTTMQQPCPAHIATPGGKVKLPKLSLPHSADVDKFNYLRSLLERTAIA